MKVEDDPAFMAWVNRVGAHLNAPIHESQSLTDSRLDYLIEYYGCEDALELYERVISNPDFGYAGFRNAYAADGKNRDQESWRYEAESMLNMFDYSDSMLQMEIYNV